MGMTFDSYKIPRPLNEPENDWEEIPTSQKTTVREYSASELVELINHFKQNGCKSVSAWLLWWWNTGGDGIILNESEMSKMALVTLLNLSFDKDYMLQAWMGMVGT